MLVRTRVCIQEVIASRRFADSRSQRCRKVYVVCADLVSRFQQLRAYCIYSDFGMFGEELNGFVCGCSDASEFNFDRNERNATPWPCAPEILFDRRVERKRLTLVALVTYRPLLFISHVVPSIA